LRRLLDVFLQKKRGFCRYETVNDLMDLRIDIKVDECLVFSVRDI